MPLVVGQLLGQVLDLVGAGLVPAFAGPSDNVTLAGYFRLGGNVDVLGLITASLELYLELKYEFQSGKCTGKAQLTIEISLFIFSGSVTVTCERKFAGSELSADYASYRQRTGLFWPRVFG